MVVDHTVVSPLGFKQSDNILTRSRCVGPLSDGEINTDFPKVKQIFITNTQSSISNYFF